ncbi:MAG TPA: cytochrome c-type biogenesis protein CcmH [Gemmatimonadaceae bacterium]|jgi:cytochrome c-type biogenesis protein CcmH
MTSRRQFFFQLVAGSAALPVLSRIASAQQRGMIHDSMVVRDSQNLFAMDQSAARSVTLPPKPNAVPVLTDRERDDLEHRLHCQCGCTLDVFTCRTTDFSCQVSPAMHRDVIALVKGGYNAQEIIDAFVGEYGQRALMAPKKSGFDLVAWILPGTAVVAGAGALVVLLKRWGARAQRPAAPSAAANVDATPDELRRLEAAVRGDDNA